MKRKPATLGQRSSNWRKRILRIAKGDVKNSKQGCRAFLFKMQINSNPFERRDSDLDKDL